MNVDTIRLELFGGSRRNRAPAQWPPATARPFREVLLEQQSFREGIDRGFVGGSPRCRLGGVSGLSAKTGTSRLFRKHSTCLLLLLSLLLLPPASLGLPVDGTYPHQSAEY